MTVEALTELFAKLGACDPIGWARSASNERIPQLARFLFLRQAWAQIIAEDDDAWIRDQLAIQPDAPGGGIASALSRLLSLGADKQDLTTVVRVMQWRLLHNLCCLLDDPGAVEEEVKHVAWRLFQTDNDGKPIAALTGLHESVLEVEPSGREMRPAPR